MWARVMWACARARARERLCVCDDINRYQWTAGRIKNLGAAMTINVDEQVAKIKQYMPETYKSIQAKAAAIGKPAFGLVRRGLRGEPNCFWAMERGHVVGTPFGLSEIERDIAQYMVTFGCTFVCIWAESVTPKQGEGSNGPH